MTPSPEHRNALSQAVWEQRKDICDLDADAVNALSGLSIRKSHGPDAGTVAENRRDAPAARLASHLAGHGGRGYFRDSYGRAL